MNRTTWYWPSLNVRVRSPRITLLSPLILDSAMINPFSYKKENNNTHDMVKNTRGGGGGGGGGDRDREREVGMGDY